METDNMKKLVEILNNLIRINNDRTEGYSRAASEIDILQAELKSYCYKMAEDSRGYKNDLIDLVISLGGEPEEDRTTTSGKFFRAWIEVKSALSANELAIALDLCEQGEESALLAYQEGLASEVEWPQNVLQLLSSQRQEIRISHDRINRYREEYNVAGKLKTT